MKSHPRGHMVDQEVDRMVINTSFSMISYCARAAAIGLLIAQVFASSNPSFLNSSLVHTMTNLVVSFIEVVILAVKSEHRLQIYVFTLQNNPTHPMQNETQIN